MSYRVYMTPLVVGPSFIVSAMSPTATAALPIIILPSFLGATVSPSAGHLSDQWCVAESPSFVTNFVSASLVLTVPCVGMGAEVATGVVEAVFGGD